MALLQFMGWWRLHPGQTSNISLQSTAANAVSGPNYLVHPGLDIMETGCLSRRGDHDV
jgi:hypothetical protein